LFETALAHSVMFVPGRAFAVDESWSEYMRLSFATLPEATLRTCATDIMHLAGLG
jgi:DNA-binding transcriptional MocR family regulator